MLWISARIRIFRSCSPYSEAESYSLENGHSVPDTYWKSETLWALPPYYEYWACLILKSPLQYSPYSIDVTNGVLESVVETTNFAKQKALERAMQD